MTEENNKEINPHAARDAAIIEALKKNDPFVLPSLEELQRMNNELWQSKDDEGTFNNCVLHSSKKEKRNEILSQFEAFEEKYGYPIPTEMKQVYLRFDINCFHVGSGNILGSINSMIENRLSGMEYLMDSNYEGEVIIPHEYIITTEEDDVWYALNLSNGGVYAYLSDHAGGYFEDVKNIGDQDMLFPDVKIANNYDLFFRGIIYAEIIYNKYVNELERKGEEPNLALLRQCTRNLQNAVGGECIDYDRWACFTGLGVE